MAGNHLLHDRDNADAGGAGCVTTAAEEAADLSPPHQIGGKLVMDTASTSKRFASQGVMPPGFTHESLQLAGIPHSDSFHSGGGAPVSNSETGAGGTDEVTAGTEDATVADLVPE